MKNHHCILLLLLIASCNQSKKVNQGVKMDNTDSFETAMEKRFYPQDVDSTIIKIENNSYKYTQTNYPGGSMGNFDMEFSLQSLSDTEIYMLKYRYEPPRKANGLLSESLERSKNLMSHPVLDSFLIEKATSDKGGFKKEELLKLKRSFSL